MNDNNKFATGTLHGNNAKINPKKKITPRFEACVFNNYQNDRYDRSYHRLDIDADLDREEVNSIEL